MKELQSIIPFKWRVHSPMKGKLLVVAYIEAVQVEDLLDEVVGHDNWQTNYREIKGNLYCDISIRFVDADGRSHWVTKSNCATESKVEQEKGEASDAFKRAARCWGVGRFLYYMEMFKIPSKDNRYPSEAKFGESVTDLVNRKYEPKIPDGFPIHESYKAVIASAKIGTSVTASVNISPKEEASEDNKVVDMATTKKKRTSSKKKAPKVLDMDPEDLIIDEDDVSPPAEPDDSHMKMEWDADWFRSRCAFFMGLKEKAETFNPSEANLYREDLNGFREYMEKHKSNMTDKGIAKSTELISSLEEALTRKPPAKQGLKSAMQNIADKALDVVQQNK